MVVIRKAEVEEAIKIHDIEIELFEDKATDYQEFYERIENQGHWFRTAKIDGIIVGYINGILEEEALELKCVAVKKDQQGDGIGELLIKSFIFIAQQQGVQKIRLSCGEDMVKYFEKYGFENKGEAAAAEMELITTEIRCSCSCK